MNKELSFIRDLSKTEKTIHKYLQEESENGKVKVRESMSDIGKKLGFSEATIYRSIRKLTKLGVIGIVPSMGKAKSNEIIYYGQPDEEKQVEDIFNLASDLSNGVRRFETLMESKDNTIRALERELKHMSEESEKLKEELHKCNKLNEGLKEILKEYEQGNKIFSEMSIGDILEIENGVKALIFK